MSPGLPASKLLVLALSKAILTIVFILWKVLTSSFSPHVSSSFLVASDIIPPAEKTKGMKRSLVTVTIAYRTTTAKPRFCQLSPRVAHHRAQKRQRARSFGLIAFRTPRLPRFTFCATAEIET